MIAWSQIQEGFLPWKPASGAELVRVFNYYDMPLAGLIREGSAYVLFECLEGQLEERNLWGYWGLLPNEAEALLEREETLRLHPTSELDEEISDRPFVLALARDGQITSVGHVDQPKKFASVAEAAREALGLEDADLRDLHIDSRL